MVEHNCAMCGKPILGYWYEVGKNKSVCQACASVTVYDLYIKGIVSLFPKTIEVDDAVIVGDKTVLSAEYGVAIDENNGENKGVVYEMPFDIVDDTESANLSD